MKKLFFALVAFALPFLARARQLDVYNSCVVSPSLGSVINNPTPVLAGTVRDTAGKPLKGVQVSVSVDRRKVAVVLTNKYGVWSYTLNGHQSLANGAHYVRAQVNLSDSNIQATRSTLFILQTTRSDENMLRSGNVNATNSAISFPFDTAYVNTQNPTIVGILLNSSSNPVAGESVQIKIDGSTITTVTSDANGVFSYTLSSALSEAAHTVGAHCVQSNVDLTTNSFVVDVTAPAAPIISAPTPNQVLTNSLVTIVGTTEANATIATFLDGSSYGDISYADGSGNWSIDYTLDNASHSIAAQASDLANNSGNVTSPVTFTVNA